MKLGQLKTAIRSTKGSPTIRIQFTTGAVVSVALMKAPLYEALDAAYSGGKNVETGLVYVADGDNAVIRPEAGDTPYSASAPGPLLAMMESVPAVGLLDVDDIIPVAQADLKQAPSTLLDL